MTWMPPGGYAGFNQMTPASRLALTGGRTMNSTRRRRRKATKKKARSASGSRRGKTRKLKFGSPAWQKKYRVGRFAKKR